MQKRYWLKGGFVVATVFLAYSLFLDWLNHIGAPVNAGLHKILLEIGYPFSFVRFLSVGFNDSFDAQLISDIVAFVVFFCVGACIGFLYGKIKNRSVLNS